MAVRQTAEKALERLKTKPKPYIIKKIEDAAKRRRFIIEAENKLGSATPKERLDAIDTLFFLGSAKSLKKVERLLNDPDPNVRKKAAFFVQVFSKDISGHPLYFDIRTKKPFFSKKRRLARSEFEKTGSRLILLGGKLTGKAIVRIIPKSAFEAWKRALEAKEAWKNAGFDYIPVEPILSKGGRLRVKETRSGKMMVMAGVLGKSLNLFLSDTRNSHLRETLEKESERILQVLRMICVEHGHVHGDNFCVQFHKGKPRLYIIDFDIATIVK